ncbi:MAG: ATP-binding protein [Lachnospiraceae bacterium]|nr:ATP-binding protein [Lachnospiraceae bacterium]
MKRLQTEAKLDNLNEVLAFADEILEEAGCSMKDQTAIDIALEEMFVNIVSYAYTDSGVPESEQTAEVIMDVSGDPASVSITLIDGGIPFDPLAKEDPDTTLSAEERQIGGLGIYMVKQTMNRVEYRREDNKNIFTMEKTI